MKLIMKKPDGSINIWSGGNHLDDEGKRYAKVVAVCNTIFYSYNKDLAIEIDTHLYKYTHCEVVYKDEIEQLENKEEFIAEKKEYHLSEAEKLLPAICEIVDDNIELGDRRVRNAWIYEDGKIKTCPNKKLAIIREVRNRQLEQLDKVELAESFKPNGKIEEVRAKKQVLRDLPANVNNLSDDEIWQLLAQ